MLQGPVSHSRRRLPATVAVLVALALALVAPGVPQAATTCTFQTTNGINNDWNDTINWSCGHVPTANDDVVIPNGQGANLTSGADGVARSISLSGGLTISGRTLTVGTGASSFGGPIQVVSGATMRLNGTTTWSAGSWSIGAGSTSTVENAGTLTITGDVAANIGRATQRERLSISVFDVT